MVPSLERGETEMMKLYCITYGILFCLYQAAKPRITRMMDWIFWQIDHNDFLSGFMFAWILFCLAWLGGVVTLGN